MASGKINIEDKGTVVIAELDLNEKNAINSGFVEQMSAILDTYENNDTIRALIVTAKGKFFSNGFDPEVLLDVDAETVEKNVGAAFRLLKRFYRLPFITIMAANGHSMGYGAVWALFFDFRFMVDTRARIGYPEALIGLALPTSTALLLNRLVGARQARDLAIFGKGLKPEGALEIGLVDGIFPPDQLMTEVEKFAAKFEGMSRQGLVGNKLSIQVDVPDSALEAAIEADFSGSREMILSPDGQEGLRSILEGRRPNFS